jgi:hypothetical protein
MKKFMLFLFTSDYPAGGLNDFLGWFNTMEEITDWIWNHQYLGSEYNFIDITTGKTYYHLYRCENKQKMIEENNYIDNKMFINVNDKKIKRYILFYYYQGYEQGGIDDFIMFLDTPQEIEIEINNEENRDNGKNYNFIDLKTGQTFKSVFNFEVKRHEIEETDVCSVPIPLLY